MHKLFLGASMPLSSDSIFKSPMQGPKTQLKTKQSKSQPTKCHAPCTDSRQKAVTLDLATSFGMLLLIQRSQTPGRIPNFSLHASFPTRSRGFGLGIWCRLALLECECTFWMWYFSFGGTTQCRYWRRYAPPPFWRPLCVIWGGF